MIKKNNFFRNANKIMEAKILTDVISNMRKKLYCVLHIRKLPNHRILQKINSRKEKCNIFRIIKYLNKFYEIYFMLIIINNTIGKFI